MTNVHELAIGDIQCAVVCDGSVTMTSAELAGRYPNATQDQIEAALGSGESQSSLNLLYINSGGTRILADVGFGTAGPPMMGQTSTALESIGVAAADIDIVYLTHFHGDHIAGLFDADGSPSYPNARYVTTTAEWDEWMGRWAAGNTANDQLQLDRFNALRDKFSFRADGDEIAPGVTVVNLEGHTLGQSGLLVESKGEQLLHVVDLLHQPFQFANIDWHFSFDSDSELAVITRRKILQHCADTGLLTLFYHLPFPGLGRVNKRGDVFTWQPIS